MPNHPRIRNAALLTLLSASACTTYDPLYCGDSASCKDPARPFCDLTGEYPASEGIARTCIPSPFDAGDGETGDGGSGSATDGGPGADSGVPNDAAPPCRWAPLSRLANVNTSGEAEYPGSLDSEGNALLFTQAGTGPGDGFYVATRETGDKAFGQPTPIAELSGDGVFRADPEISSSGLEILYRLIDGSAIESATRSSPAGEFGAPEGTGLTGTSPALSADSLSIYFLDEGNVQRARRRAIGEPWATPATVLPATGSLYYSIDISTDERRLLLTSLEIEPFPIFVADRDSVDDDFGAPVPLNEEILFPGAGIYSVSKWGASERQMVVSLQSDDGVDMYYSVCE